MMRTSFIPLLAMLVFFIGGCASSSGGGMASIRPWYEDVNPVTQDEIMSDWEIFDINSDFIAEQNDTVEDLQFEVSELLW